MEPSSQKGHYRLENIQRKASRFVKSCNSRDPGTVTGLLADLGWNSLKQRRTKHDLTLFYQAVNSHIEIPLPPYGYVIPVKRNNKSHNEKGYIQMFAKNDQYKNRFIPRTIPIWYRLPLAYSKGSGYGYGTVPGGRWAIDTEGGHVVDSVSLIRNDYEYGRWSRDRFRTPPAKVAICL